MRQGRRWTRQSIQTCISRRRGWLSFRVEKRGPGKCQTMHRGELESVVSSPLPLTSWGTLLVHALDLAYLTESRGRWGKLGVGR